MLLNYAVILNKWPFYYPWVLLPLLFRNSMVFPIWLRSAHAKLDFTNLCTFSQELCIRLASAYLSRQLTPNWISPANLVSAFLKTWCKQFCFPSLSSSAVPEENDCGNRIQKALIPTRKITHWPNPFSSTTGLSRKGHYSFKLASQHQYPKIQIPMTTYRWTYESITDVRH